MPHNLTIGRQIYSRERTLLLKKNSAIQVNYWNDDSEKLKGFRNIVVLIASHGKVFPGNKYKSYIHTARSAKVTLQMFMRKLMKWKKQGFQKRI